MGIEKEKYRKILKAYWGYDDFRGIQYEIIESITAGKDTLGLMPTGGGKSVTFQVPALALSGVCIVITPLIALMKDQVANLRKRGIKAAAIYSGMMHADILTTLENAIFGGVKILYVSPERLSSELFQKKIGHADVNFITVDEAHCISQWGYDFRPSYLNIATIRKLKPNCPILALTATATPKVIDDIQDKLGFHAKNVFKMSFERKNLAYVVRTCNDKTAELLHILNSIKGTAIVYVRNKKQTKEIAQLLNKQKITATFYNAGLETADRDNRQKDWSNDKMRVMVATNAFGMGIDKPDVRVVIHLDCPDSIEAYFQEAGRAGRDGQKAYAILLYNSRDNVKLRQRVNNNFPDKEEIRTIYEHLAYFYQIAMGSGSGCKFEFNIDTFCQAFKHFPTIVNSALTILSRAGYIEYQAENDARSQVKMLLKRDSLYLLDSLTETENSVITALLRNYGGLFVDYCYIDESLISIQTGLSKQSIYLILKDLSQRNILHFIPRRKIPHIIYLQQREEKERLIISKEIYDDRKAEYIERIQAMLAYASNSNVCRSRQLLSYFGEEKSTDCRQCDVCIAHKKEMTSKAFQKACQLIKDTLADKKEHIVTDIKNIDYNKDAIEEALRFLVKNEDIIVKDGLLLLA